MHPERSRSQYLCYHLQFLPHPYTFCLSLPMLSTWPWSSKPPPPYNPSPHLPFLTPVQLECLSTMPSSRSTSWKPSPYQTHSQSTMSMALQMRTDPSWRRLRSYSNMASTWRRHALQLQTLGDKLSSLDTCGLSITTQRLTGLTRASPCLAAPLSVEGSQVEVEWGMMDWNLEMQSTLHSFPLSGKNSTLEQQIPHHSG